MSERSESKRTTAAPVPTPVIPAGADAVRDLRVSVSITVPALTLLGDGDEPAVLDGYGPIPLETAKVLAAGASSWHRVLTHPVTGVRLTLDRTTYTVPAALREWLVLRDHTCRFPGCSRTATGCDVDHTIAWEDGGCTDADNLAHLCRKHHRLKHHTPWRYEHLDDTTIIWTSPTGHTYLSHPPDG